MSWKNWFKKKKTSDKYPKTISYIDERKQHLAKVLSDLTGGNVQGVSDNQNNVHVKKFKNHLKEWQDLERIILQKEFSQSDLDRIIKLKIKKCWSSLMTADTFKTQKIYA